MISTRNLWFVCQLDTGASCNVISYRDLSILLQNGTPKVEQSSVKLKMYDCSIMRPIGETVLKVKHNDSYHTLKFQVVDNPDKPLNQLNHVKCWV